MPDVLHAAVTTGRPSKPLQQQEGRRCADLVGGHRNSSCTPVVGKTHGRVSRFYASWREEATEKIDAGLRAALAE